MSKGKNRRLLEEVREAGGSGTIPRPRNVRAGLAQTLAVGARK